MSRKPDRFNAIRESALYRLPSKRRQRIPLDGRFSRILRDENFASQPKVDHYGRKLPSTSGTRALARLYQTEEPVVDLNEDSDREGVKDQPRVELGDKVSDPAREGGFSDLSSGSEDSSSDEEIGVPEAGDVHDRRLEEVPAGDISSRLAVVNLDWDHIQAVDLLAVFSSFVPKGGRLIRATVYPSAFGKERMDQELVEGPPRYLFAAERGRESGQQLKEDMEHSDQSEDDERIKQSLVQEDKGDDLNPEALRQYQLDRLRYFYAVLDCSSAQCAKAIYDAIDGAEYQSTANFFDLRFIPDEMDFSEDTPRDECSEVPETYRPADFVTDALQHSKVKLSWDADDPRRMEAQKRAFSTKKNDLEVNDLRTYLASGSSDDEPSDATEQVSSKAERENHRQHIRASLGLSDREQQQQRAAETVGDMEITFASGLGTAGGLQDDTNVLAKDETTLEKYIRKEKERKLHRKQGNDERVQSSVRDTMGKEDLGFDDPFFESATTKTISTRKSKNPPQSTGIKDYSYSTESNTQRAELELLLENDRPASGEASHFDKRELKRQAKALKKRKGSRKSPIGRSIEEPSHQDNLPSIKDDTRFKALYEQSDFAIDPSHPRFERTNAMEALLKETRRKRRRTNDD